MDNRLVVKLNDGMKLVAAATEDPDCKEIYVGIEDKNGVWLQDLAVVREDYTIEEDEFRVPSVIPKHDNYEVFVWNNPWMEDWTDSFQIPLYDEFKETHTADEELK